MLEPCPSPLVAFKPFNFVASGKWLDSRVLVLHFLVESYVDTIINFCSHMRKLFRVFGMEDWVSVARGLPAGCRKSALLELTTFL